MGENKLLLVLDGEALVRRAVSAAMTAGLAPIIVVLGHEAEKVAAALEGLPCRTVINPDHARGKGTSLQVGIRAAADTNAGAAVVMPVTRPPGAFSITRGTVAAGVVTRTRSTGWPMSASEE